MPRVEAKLSDRIQAWHRLPGEGEKAYEAFETYLHLGKDRSIDNVSTALVKSRSLLSKWSAKYDWVDRARAYDNAIISVTDQELEHNIKNQQVFVVNQESEDYNNLLHLWRDRFEKFKDIPDEKFDLNEFKNLIAARERITAMGRRVAEMPMTYVHNPKPVKEDDGLQYLAWPDRPGLAEPADKPALPPPQSEPVEEDVIDIDFEDTKYVSDKENNDADSSEIFDS